MKLSRGDKPFIDYAKMDLQDATKQLLFCFSQEELDCRDYYRMEAALDIAMNRSGSWPAPRGCAVSWRITLGNRPRSPM